MSTKFAWFWPAVVFGVGQTVGEFIWKPNVPTALLVVEGFFNTLACVGLAFFIKVINEP